MKLTLRKFILTSTFLLSLFAAIYLIAQRTNFFGKASGELANLDINLETRVPRKNYFWRNLAQGGEEQGRMLASVITETRTLQPEYIRIDHVFDFYNTVSRAGDGSLVFNWEKLDQTLTDIASIGAKPFISLSYTPPVMSLSGNTTDAPLDWGAWELLVKSTIEHISRDRGIDGVYYEVWNEPDLFGGWKVYGAKNYFDLYLHSAIGAQRAQGARPFKLGGPATTALYENWFGDFLKFTQDNNLRLDFYSWHRYAYDTNDFEKDAFNSLFWRSEAPLRFGEMEIVISEMGHDSKNHSGYDNRFGAIHTVATLATMDGKVDRAFSFEIKDGPGPSQLWGRWGILTHDNFGTAIKKPRYDALSFLNQMEGNRVLVSGMGTWVKAFASEAGGVIKVLIVNFDPQGKHTETVPITLSNLPSASYTLKRIDFGGGTRTTQLDVISAGLNLTEIFSPNTAAILELTPK